MAPSARYKSSELFCSNYALCGARVVVDLFCFNASRFSIRFSRSDLDEHSLLYVIIYGSEPRKAHQMSTKCQLLKRPCIGNVRKINSPERVGGRATQAIERLDVYYIEARQPRREIHLHVLWMRGPDGTVLSCTPKLTSRR